METLEDLERCIQYETSDFYLDEQSRKYIYGLFDITCSEKMVDVYCRSILEYVYYPQTRCCDGPSGCDCWKGCGYRQVSIVERIKDKEKIEQLIVRELGYLPKSLPEI